MSATPLPWAIALVERLFSSGRGPAPKGWNQDSSDLRLQLNQLNCIGNVKTDCASIHLYIFYRSTGRYKMAAAFIIDTEKIALMTPNIIGCVELLLQLFLRILGSTTKNHHDDTNTNYN